MRCRRCYGTMGDEYGENSLCVTLERDITVPGAYHEPFQASVFRATERSVHDDATSFFGLNIGPPNTVVEVSNDNIRAVVNLGEYPEHHPYHDDADSEDEVSNDG